MVFFHLWKTIALTLLLIPGAAALGASAGASTASPQAAPDTPSALRQWAYGKSGDWLYQGLPRLEYPPARLLAPGEQPFHLPLAWIRQAAENKGRLPLFEPCALDYRSASVTVTAYLASFRTQYHPDAEGWFDAFFKEVRVSPRFSRRWKREFAKNEARMRERSMISYLAFEPGKVRLAYYPGAIQFKGGFRKRLEHWLPATPPGIRRGNDKSYALIKDSRGLLAILNGTFDRSDNYTKCHSDPSLDRFGGFGFRGKAYLPPQNAMATCAIYRDGRVRLGTYAALPRKKEIGAFVQNRFMVVENGKPGKDADPDAFFNYYADIARSYLFLDREGRLGFIWTLDTPPNVLVPIALEMGVKDMMLLDIHSPIYASVADPAGPLTFTDGRDYTRRSFDLVPSFARLSSLGACLTWISTAVQSRIQTDYPDEAFRVGNEDYFAVFIKD